MIEVMEHTADVRLRVTAPTLEELFREALRATIELLQPLKGTNPAQRDVVVEAADTTVLLIDFLNAALSSAYAHQEAYHDAIFSTLTETQAAARLTGTEAVAFGEDVKAVTYHEAEVRRDATGRWSTMLVYDI